DGTVAGWGENTDADGQPVGQSSVPLGLTNVIAIAAGHYHSLAARADGAVVAWGDNSQNQCNVPAGLTNIVAVAGGGSHSLALGADGSVTAWGANWNKQCLISPIFFPCIGIAAGSEHSVCLFEGATPALGLFSPLWQTGHFSALLQTVYRKTYLIERSDSLGA